MLAGAALALVTQHAVGWVITPPPLDSTQGGARVFSPLPSSALTFAESKAAIALGELSAGEMRAVAEYLVASQGWASRRSQFKEQCWIAGPSGVELMTPPKTAALAYIDGDADAPPRYARVSVVSPGEDATISYRVGPIVEGVVADGATVVELGRLGPLAKRPTEPGGDADFSQRVLDGAVLEIGAALLVEAAFGAIFPVFFVANKEAFDFEVRGRASPMMVNDVLSASGERWSHYHYSWIPPSRLSRLESFWLHPMPLRIHVNETHADPEQWTALDVFFCGKRYESPALLKEEHARGSVAVCAFRNETGDLPWEVPSREDAAQAERRVATDRGVTWGDWTFTVSAQRPSTGPALLDVRFGGERVLYELSLQDAMAAYSGDENTQFFYSDAAWSLSMLSASLEPGVDCPPGATYLGSPNSYALFEGGDATADASAAVTFYPTCVFEWEEDHTVWRHMQNSEPVSVRGLARRTAVVRSVCTVGNYDYITDVKFREDGEIEVSVKFAGYVEARHFDPNANDYERAYSTILRPDLAGPVHSHNAAFKADVDVAGVRENACRVTSVIVERPPGAALPSKVLKHRYVADETESAFVADPRKPGVWSLVDRNATSAAGNPRGYAIALGSWATTQVLPDDHPFTLAAPYSKYHLAVTKHHDDEYRISSPSAQYDGYDDNGPQNLDTFLNGENLIDQDLIAWIAVGREHVVRQEDLPLVSNFGVSFSLLPWNFLPHNAAASGLP